MLVDQHNLGNLRLFFHRCCIKYALEKMVLKMNEKTQQYFFYTIGTSLFLIAFIFVLYVTPNLTSGDWSTFVLNMGVLLLGLALLVVWYRLIGNKVVDEFLNYIQSEVRGGNFDPRSQFELQVERLLREKRFDECIETCRKWMRYDRDHAAPHMMISQILVDHKHDRNQAIQELEITISRPFPAEDHVAIALRLAELYRLTGKVETIEPMFQRIRSLHSRSPEIKKLDNQ